MASLPLASEWKEGTESDLNVIKNCYCPHCQKGNATTTMLPTKVPMFRELVIMSLYCPDCYFRNSEVTFGGEIQEKGKKIMLQLTKVEDLDRQLVKSNSAILSIPELNFEIPSVTQRGTISTIEGVLKVAASNLEQLQSERLKMGDLDNFYRCKKVIHSLRFFAGITERESDPEDNQDNQGNENDNLLPKRRFPFHVFLDDPAGNSFIENFMAPQPDPNLRHIHYYRTATQDLSLGLQPSQAAVEAGRIDDANPDHKNEANISRESHPIENSIDQRCLGRCEVVKIPTCCPHCHKNAETNMCITDIPHFKEVVIMNLACEECGYRSSEIKGGGSISQHGTRITLLIQGMDDLDREVLKSDTAGIKILELELDLEDGGLNGVYTTVEGLLRKLHDRLAEANPFGVGDASMQHHLGNDGKTYAMPLHTRYREFLNKLTDVADGHVYPVTLIIDDPLSNSFIGPILNDALALGPQSKKHGKHYCCEQHIDENLTIEEYQRTHEQNEVLGLNDMKTEDYE